MASKLPDFTAADILAEVERRKYNRINYVFQDFGKYPRKNYKKHMDFIGKTSDYREICFMAANRAGKSETGAFAIATWLTGRYPDWWTGRVFKTPPNILVCGETAKLVRDSVQVKLMGRAGDYGTGLIPKDRIASIRPKAGIPDAIDTARIHHDGGGESVLQLMSYDQGRAAFQATERDVIWEDEEPPEDVHNENLIRTMTTNGIVLLTFTPLKGLSQTVMAMQDKARRGVAAIVQATWDDAPHLSEADKKSLMDALPLFQRDARSKGIPQLGSGAIYPVPEEQFIVDPFKVPDHYKVCYGLDVGWNNTAAVWLAHDIDSDVVYVTHDYKAGQAEPAVHAASIRARGVHLFGAIDPASQGRSQKDGEQLVELYKALGLQLNLADNTVEAGIFDIYERLTTGRLKIFSTCTKTLDEMRMYRRDEKGKVVKQHDHCMDALRYAIRTGLYNAVYGKFTPPSSRPRPQSAMGRF